MTEVAETRDRLAKRFPDCRVSVWHHETYTPSLTKVNDCCYTVMIVGKYGDYLAHTSGKVLASVASDAANNAVSCIEDTKAAAIQKAINLLQAEGYEV